MHPDTTPPRSSARLLLYVTLAILAGVLALLVVVAANTPGNSRSGDGFIEQVISNADGSARVTVPLVLKEGDPKHEAAHVFESVSALPGVRTARLVLADTTLVLAYDPKVATEAGIRAALASAGYLTDAPAAP